MRTSVISIALVALCIFTFPASCVAQQAIAPQSPGNASEQLCAIAGTVLSANTGEPLKKAYVYLHRREDESRENALTATSDATGHFAIEKIPPGKYDLSVDRANYLGTHYGQDQHDKPGAILSLAPGQRIMDLLFRLHRTSVIAGRVVDEDGDPVSGVDVIAVARAVVRGKPKIEFSGRANTNDLGEYRVADLAPGRYLIVASPPQVSGMWSSSEHADGYAPTYYPATPDSARASALEVKSGDEITGIDFVLAPKVPMRTYKIHGRVMNSLAEDPDAYVIVMLIRRGGRDDDFDSNQPQMPADRKTGAFEFKDVVPGEYLAAAMAIGGGRRHLATQNVDVIAGDIENVSLTLTRGIDIPVRVALEGKSATSADISVVLDPSHTEGSVNFAESRRALVQPDGSFVLKEVNDGSYSLEVYSECQECYLKSARGKGVDLLEQGLQVVSGEAPSPIGLVYSSNSGKVTGMVTTKDDLPAPGALVVLVPDASSHQKPEAYKTSTTDQYGHFEIRGVPSGHYKAFAWEKADEDSYGDPDFLRPFESMAESFDIGANEQKSVQLTMIAAADSTN